MLWTDRVSNSPPTNTWTAMADAPSRTASSTSRAISSFDSSLRMLGPPLARRTIPAPIVGGIDGPQDPPGEHQGVGVRDERDDAEVDPLQAGRRSLEVAVVDREHDGAAAVWPEDAGQAVLHPPVVGRRALEEEELVLLRDPLVELLGLAAVGFWHRSSRPSCRPSGQAPAGHHIGRRSPVSDRSRILG